MVLWNKHLPHYNVRTYSFAHHWFILIYIMQISYCIAQQGIELCEPGDSSMPRSSTLKVHLANCVQPLSLMQIGGKLGDINEISYLSSERPGMIACVQLIKKGYLMEFNTDECMEMDFCQNFADVRFITAEVPFRFRYLKGGTLRRIDIFFPESTLLEILHPSYVSLIRTNGHLVVERSVTKSFAREIHTFLRELYNDPSEEKICLQTRKLVRLLKKWSLNYFKFWILNFELLKPVTYYGKRNLF